MEISGKVLREVEFRDRLRGYDTDEVDEFLEQVAIAVDELREEQAAALARAERAERQLQEAPDFDDDGIRRTLVLAQRTADLALREARTEAEQMLGEARARAEAILAQAEEEAARLRDEADHDVRLRATQLTEQHERLTREIRILGALLESERTRITQSLSDTLRFVSESMGVSDDLSSALGGQAEVSRLGDDADTARYLQSRLARPAGQPSHAAPHDDREAAAGERRPQELSPPRPPLQPTPSRSGPPSEATPTVGPATSGHAQPERPPQGGQAVPNGGASPAGSAGAGSAGPGSGQQAPPPPGPVKDGSPHPQASQLPPPPPSVAPRSGPPQGGSAGQQAERSAPPAGSSRRGGAGSNGSPRAERDIEAELLEDAGLSTDRRRLWDEPPPGPTSRPGPGMQAEAADDEALWARWAPSGKGVLDPLAEPPPTQAYRLESDGGWSA